MNDHVMGITLMMVVIGSFICVSFVIFKKLFFNLVASGVVHSGHG